MSLLQAFFESVVRDNAWWIFIDRMLMTVALLAAPVAFIFRRWLGAALRRWLGHRYAGVGGEMDGASVDALIFTVSKADLPIMSIKKLNPRMVGMLRSDDSKDDAREIGDYCRSKNIEVFERSIEHVDNVAAAKRYTLELVLEAKQRNAASLAVDITGAKKPMSIGAFMAAEEEGIKSIYTTCDYTNDRERKPKPNTAHIVIVSEPKAVA